MPLQIIRSDITKVSADAIVNSTNPNPSRSGYGGADFHIYEAAGRNALQKAREEIGHLDVADIAVSPAFGLSAKYIIHTVGPRWNDGRSGELFALENCYMKALEKARELGCASIAFSLISSGSYHFPKDLALKAAVEVIGNFLQTNEMDVILVVFDKESFEISAELDNNIKSFIDENYVQKEEAIREQFFEESVRSGKFQQFRSDKSLEEFLTASAETFQQKLFQLIQKKKSRRHVYLQEGKSQPPALFKNPKRHPIQPQKENRPCACRRHAAFPRRNRGPSRPRRARPFAIRKIRPNHHLLYSP